MRKIPLNTSNEYYCCKKGKVYRLVKDKYREIKGWLEESRYNTGKYYYRVQLKVNGVYKKFYKHRLILTAFEGMPATGDVGRHLNDISLDNRLINLAWGTIQENVDDKYRNRNERKSN